MNHSDTAVCIICGRNYPSCLSCKSQALLKPWKSITDTADCYKLFLVISQYNNGYLSKEEAGKQLKKIRYQKKNLKKSVQDKITEIISISKSTRHEE